MQMLWQCPSDARAALVFAHGAGAGMTHHSLQSIADAFERTGIATLRFNFPFMEAGRKRVDSRADSVAAVAAAARAAAERSKLPLWFGGHSFGGRMCSHAVLEAEVDPDGLVFCSFPLHPAGKPSTSRATHLPAVRQPMLFLSGTRDALADRELLERVVAELPRAELHWLDTADHGYRVQRRARGTAEDVFDEMARITRAYIDRHYT
jgi:predicted alpha/beta-hydrolase family hydrolase